MTTGQVISKYEKNEEYITSYYTIHDTLYDMDSSMNDIKVFVFTDDTSVVLGTGGKIENYDDETTYYVKDIPSPPDATFGTYSVADVDVSNQTLSVRIGTNYSVHSIQFKIEDDTLYNPKKHYYRVENTTPNVNYVIKGNRIVFNNISSMYDSSNNNTGLPQQISVNYTKYTRKHDKDKTYFHGAEDGLFMHENKKRSVANAMNEDIKVMIRQNEQMMVLGGITLATLVVGAYVILRN